MRLLSVAALVAASVVGGCHREQQPQSQETSEAAAPQKGADRSHSGQPMPAADILNPDDDQTTLADAKGKPVLVNLWASWCAPCVKELPTLDALSQKPGAPRVLIVSEDFGKRPSVDAFLDQHGIELASWRDPKMSLSTALGVQVMPTTIYYDASGREVWRYIGDLDWTGEEAAKLLGETAAPAKS